MRGSLRSRTAWGTLLLRVTVGIVYLMHGYLAYYVVRPRGMMAFLSRLGFPENTVFLFAWYLILAHLVGGLLMVIGLWARTAALVNVPIMLYALLLIHVPQGFFIRAVIVDPGAGRAMTVGYELALLVLASTLAVALIGPGALSIDAGRRPRERSPR